MAVNGPRFYHFGMQSLRNEENELPLFLFEIIFVEIEKICLFVLSMDSFTFCYTAKSFGTTQTSGWGEEKHKKIGLNEVFEENHGFRSRKTKGGKN